MPALFGKTAHGPDAHLKALKNEAKELDMQSQAQWLFAILSTSGWCKRRRASAVPGSEPLALGVRFLPLSHTLPPPLPPLGTALRGCG
jgi:hypothetical protein